MLLHQSGHKSLFIHFIKFCAFSGRTYSCCGVLIRPIQNDFFDSDNMPPSNSANNMIFFLLRCVGFPVFIFRELRVFKKLCYVLCIPSRSRHKNSFANLHFSFAHKIHVVNYFVFFENNRVLDQQHRYQTLAETLKL